MNDMRFVLLQKCTLIHCDLKQPSRTVATIAHRFELSQVQLGTLLHFKSQMDGKRAREKESPQRALRIMPAPHREYAFVESFVLCVHAMEARDEKNQAAIKYETTFSL